MNTMDFVIWKRRRDTILHNNIGLTSGSLPDASWYSYWADGLDPQQAIEAAIDDVWYDEPLIKQLLQAG